METGAAFDGTGRKTFGNCSKTRIGTGIHADETGMQRCGETKSEISYLGQRH